MNQKKHQTRIQAKKEKGKEKGKKGKEKGKPAQACLNPRPHRLPTRPGPGAVDAAPHPGMLWADPLREEPRFQIWSLEQPSKRDVICHLLRYVVVGQEKQEVFVEREIAGFIITAPEESADSKMADLLHVLQQGRLASAKDHLPATPKGHVVDVVGS